MIYAICKVSTKFRKKCYAKFAHFTKKKRKHKKKLKHETEIHTHTVSLCMCVLRVNLPHIRHTE